MQSIINPRDIHAVILAGGEGRRMGGVDKGLALFHGQPLAQRAAQRVAASVSAVSINANRNLLDYQLLGFSVFNDAAFNSAALDNTPPSHEGPLGGVLAALRQGTAPYLAVLPCDVPFFPPDIVTQLAQKLADSDAKVAMPLVTQADGSVFPDPVFMVMHASVLPDLEAYFTQGGRKITTWAGRAGLALVPFSQPQHAQAFMDADTAAALAALNAAKPAS